MSPSPRVLDTELRNPVCDARVPVPGAGGRTLSFASLTNPSFLEKSASVPDCQRHFLDWTRSRRPRTQRSSMGTAASSRRAEADAASLAERVEESSAEGVPPLPQQADGIMDQGAAGGGEGAGEEEVELVAEGTRLRALQLQGEHRQREHSRMKTLMQQQMQRSPSRISGPPSPRPFPPPPLTQPNTSPLSPTQNPKTRNPNQRAGRRMSLLPLQDLQVMPPFILLNVSQIAIRCAG